MVKAVATAAILGMLATTASGCAAVKAPAAAANTARPTIKTTIYFLTADRSAPLGVRRTITRMSPFALPALRALLAGPTQAERRRGVETAIPGGTKLLSFRIAGTDVAIIDLSGLAARGAPTDRVRVITQVTRSLVGLSGIRRVRLRNDGQPWGLYRVSGGVADIAYGYDNLLGFAQVGGAGGSFSALP